MDPTQQNKISPKLLLVIGAFLLVLILVFSILTLSNNAKKTTGESQQNNGSQTPADNRPTPTFIPPEDFTYSTVQSVNFLPEKINEFVIDKVKVDATARQLYPNADPISLLNSINKDIFEWLALNEYYQVNDVSKVSAGYSVKRIENMSNISRDLQKLRQAYNPTVIKMNGFYLRLRYRGTLKSNVEKLRRNESELQSIALPLIQSYREQAVKDPTTVLANFNKNNTVYLLNNRETSKTFTNYQMYPPLVADTNFLQVMQSLPVGQVSDIITLRTKLPGTTSVQDYAYAVFYVSKKTGTNLPVEALANSYVAEAEIE